MRIDVTNLRHTTHTCAPPLMSVCMRSAIHDLLSPLNEGAPQVVMPMHFKGSYLDGLPLTYQMMCGSVGADKADFEVRAVQGARDAPVETTEGVKFEDIVSLANDNLT